MPLGRTGRWLGWGLTQRTIALLAGGFVLVLPAFFHPRWVGFLLAWDALVLALSLADAWRLPGPEAFTVERQFPDAPQLGEPTRVELLLRTQAEQALQLLVTDDLHPALVDTPLTHRVDLLPRDPAVVVSTVWPRERGEFVLGAVYLRWRGALGLAERWGAARPLPISDDDAAAPRAAGQVVHVLPAHRVVGGSEQIFLIRARQMDRQRRQQRLRGTGREFESLREYQPGDELRAVSWSATARRGKVITRQFMAERSQEVWAVLDAGRLSRTALELRRGDAPHFRGETEAERDEVHRLAVTQLDGATGAVAMLAQVVLQSGDRFGMLSYGAAIQQVLPTGAGANHLRLLLDLLSATRSDPSESDPLLAVTRLKQLQRRRGLFLWFTELPDTAERPAVVTAIADLARRHVVVLVLLQHPDLQKLAEQRPADRAAMFHAAAALEMQERRREIVATLERQGVLLVEVSAEEIGLRTVNQYLDVKARGLL